MVGLFSIVIMLPAYPGNVLNIGVCDNLNINYNYEKAEDTGCRVFVLFV